MVDVESRKNLRDRGAVAVEAAIAAPLIFLLIFSIVWGALLFRSYLTVSHAAKSGARTGSIASNMSNADFQILTGVKSNLSAIAKSDVERIVIYNADTFDSPPPDTCVAGVPAEDVCNVYGSEDLDRPETDFGVGGWDGDDHWSAADRTVVRSKGESYVGVYVRTKANAGGLGLPVPASLSARKVVKVEARSY